MSQYPWYSEEICKKMCNVFIKDHPQLDMSLLREMAASGSIDEFRTVCNCLYVHQYSPSQFYNMSHEDSWELRKLCNARVHDMLGKYDELYNKFFKVWKSERWGGDETWRLFCDGYKPYEESKAILTLIDMIRYLDKPLTMEDLPRINDMYSHGRYWELYVEDMYSFHIEIPSQFNEANRRRRIHTLRWRQFMGYIWEGDFDSGRSIIDLYDKEHDAHIEEARRRNNAS